MARNDAFEPPIRDTRLEREIERERNEHIQNHYAKTNINFDSRGATRMRARRHTRPECTAKPGWRRHRLAVA